MKIEIDREKHKIKISECKSLILPEYNDGFYAILPKGSIRDNNLTSKMNSTDIFEWMYNNELQVGGKYLNASRGNRVAVLGSMKDIFKEFEQYKGINPFNTDIEELDVGKLEEEFWQYYIKHNQAKFDKALKMFRDYVKKQRKLLSSKWKKKEKELFPYLTEGIWTVGGPYDYLKHLIKRNSTKGYCYEVIILNVLKNLIDGATLTESNEIQEQEGIDGVITVECVDFPISLKPATYYNEKGSKVFNDRLIVYNRPKNDAIDFTFVSGFDLFEKITDEAIEAINKK